MKHFSNDDITRDKKPINCKSGKLEKVKTVEMCTEVENSEKLQQKKTQNLHIQNSSHKSNIQNYSKIFWNY